MTAEPQSDIMLDCNLSIVSSPSSKYNNRMNDISLERRVSGFKARLPSAKAGFDTSPIGLTGPGGCDRRFFIG